MIDAAAKNLRQYYAYRDVGQKMADSLLAHEKNGDDDAVADGAAFADLLTKTDEGSEPRQAPGASLRSEPLCLHPVLMRRAARWDQRLTTMYVIGRP